MKRMFAIPFVSALIGGGVVVAVIAATGGLGTSQKTVTEVTAASPIAPSNVSQQNTGLTPHQIYEKDAPGVAFVTSTIVRQSRIAIRLRRQKVQQQGTATGSGFVINSDGTILTNYHVVENAVKVTVSFEHGKTVEAKVDRQGSLQRSRGAAHTDGRSHAAPAHARRLEQSAGG